MDYGRVVWVLHVAKVGNFFSPVYLIWRSFFKGSYKFLSATEYHSNADYNSRRVGFVVVVVVVVVVIVHTFKNGLTFEHLDRFASYLEGSCTRVSRFASYAYDMIGPPHPAQPAQPAYQPKSEKRE